MILRDPGGLVGQTSQHVSARSQCRSRPSVTDDPASQGDIAIKDGLIIAVGDRTGTGRLPDITGDKEFDASGCLVTPGWVDAHTHMDGQVTWVRPQPLPYFDVRKILEACPTPCACPCKTTEAYAS